MRVIATSTGYDGTCIREAGEQFDMPDGSCDPVPVKRINEKTGATEVVPGQFEPPTWFKKVDGKTAQTNVADLT